nr:AraC family transcriptional regulator [Flavihumibacter fluvii]
MSGILSESALIVGIIVILILLFYGAKNNRNNLVLAVSVGTIWLCLAVSHLNATAEILLFPALMRTGNIFVYLVIPFLYIFSRNTFYPGRLWRPLDWLFLLPAIIYIVDLMPFFFSDSTYKVAVMKANLADRPRMFNVTEGWIAIKGFHFIFRYIWSVAIFALQARLIYKNRHIKFDRSETGNNKLFLFILTYTAFHIPLIVPGIFGVIFHLKWYNFHYIIVNLSIAILSLTLFILFSPSVLYGFLPRPLFESVPEANTAMVEDVTILGQRDSEQQEKKFLDTTEIAEIIARVESYIRENKPYLNPRYNIHDLSRDTKIPVYQLSPIINQHFNTNFNNWINTYRVNQFVKLCEEPKNFGLTIDALATDAGFANRATLTTAFKKEKNQTPGLYLKQQRLS